MTAQILTNLTRRKTGTIAHLTISRPSKLNALNTYLLEQIPKTLQSLTSQNNDLLGIVLTGAGDKAFVGGADIAEMAALDSPSSARTFISKVHGACDSLRQCPVPVIGRVNGYALGAGLELAASCDFRVASSNAVFGMPEVKIGIPSVVEAALLPGLIGWGRTRQLLMLGENIGAQEALSWGLVEKITKPEDLDEAVEIWLSQLEKNGPLAVTRQKALMRTWENVSMDEAIRAGITAFEEAFIAENGKKTEPSRMMEAFFLSKKSNS
ncbi:hypothetical protein N7493_000453 [Penicillium malachiteum]|uniref:Enoyl-CoA hydratase n=1 Tax=Penicillium malachiteum TaxID=1324776 RepID=A0AAD6HWC3_9EURO|nr:hypothetical protein N7493_000453 [Penicillium malachiteum]